MLKRKIFSLVLVLVLVLSVTSVSAESGSKFTDVGEDHWAYEYIKLMSDYKIINGYGDGRFGPTDAVTREQFAKMMVLTLQLDPVEPSTPFFTDVDKGDWVYKYVEAAKNYLTGYKVSGGYEFRPRLNAEREDMAVAIVRGMGLSVEGVDLSVLDQFKDEDAISTSLRPYVAKIVEEGIMIGDDQGYFGPRNTLQRAEAATLLARLIVDEKVVFDEEKIVIDEQDPAVTDSDRTPVLETYEYDGKIKLNWSQVSSDGFSYYKVVVSKYDSSPSYPENGRTQALGNVWDTRAYLKGWQTVYDGDVDQLQPGEKYYVSITAVYGDDYYPSNVVQVTIPEQEVVEVPDQSLLAVTLTGDVSDGGIKLNWTEAPASGFVYYKVVFSETDTTPVYPGDGYLTYISDRSNTYYFAHEGQKHQGNNSFYLDDNVIYHISITAVYNIDGKKYYVPSNTVSLLMPDR